MRPRFLEANELPRDPENWCKVFGASPPGTRRLVERVFLWIDCCRCVESVLEGIAGVVMAVNHHEACDSGISPIGVSQRLPLAAWKTGPLRPRDRFKPLRQRQPKGETLTGICGFEWNRPVPRIPYCHSGGNI